MWQTTHNTMKFTVDRSQAEVKPFASPGEYIVTVNSCKDDNLDKNGKLLIVGTRIAATDFYRELREPKYWSGGKCPFTYMGMPAVLEYDEDPDKWVTLWAKSDAPWDGDEDTPDENDPLYDMVVEEFESALNEGRVDDITY